MTKGLHYLIIGGIILLIMGVVIGIAMSNIDKISSEIIYKCEIDNTESSTTSIDCTSDSDCNIVGLMCDTLLYKCVIVPSGKVIDNNGNDVSPRYSYIATHSKKECDEIGGFWKAEIKN